MRCGTRGRPPVGPTETQKVLVSVCFDGTYKVTDPRTLCEPRLLYVVRKITPKTLVVSEKRRPDLDRSRYCPL